MGFATGQGGGGLAQPDVAKAHVAHGLQLGLDAREVVEQLQGLLHGHVQHLGDGAVAELDFQRLAVVASSAADLAGDGDVGEELHLNLGVAVALTCLAAPALDVEGEATWSVAPDAGFRERGEQLADGCEGPGVGRGIAAGCAPDGRLVDVDYLVDLVQAGDGVVSAGAVLGSGHVLGQALVQHLVHQAALAGAGYAGNAGEHPQGHGDVDSLEVILASALHF